MLIYHHTAGGLSILQETFLELEPTSSYLMCRCWSSTSLPWPTLSYPRVPQLISSYTRSSLSYPIEPHPSSSYTRSSCHPTLSYTFLPHPTSQATILPSPILPHCTTAYLVLRIQPHPSLPSYPYLPHRTTVYLG